MKFVFALVLLGFVAFSEAKIKSGGFPWWLYAATKASTTPDPMADYDDVPNSNFGGMMGVPSSQGMFLRQAPADPSAVDMTNPMGLPPMPMSPYYGYPPMPMFNPFFGWKMQKIYMEQVLNITTTPKPPKPLKIKIKGSPMAGLPMGAYEIDTS